MFVASSVATIDGGSFTASAGGQIYIPHVRSVSNSDDDEWRATGIGSLISMSVRQLTNGDCFDCDMTLSCQYGSG